MIISYKTNFAVDLFSYNTSCNQVILMVRRRFLLIH